jgi:hypothetical protein
MTPPTTYVLRTCDAKNCGYGGFKWPTSGPVSAPDWDPRPVCGGGLHGVVNGAPGPYTCSDKRARWLVVEVETASIVSLHDQVKFPAGVVVYCGDRDGAIDWLVAHGIAEEATVGKTPRPMRVHELMTHIARNHGHSAWGDINPTLAATLRLAFTAAMPFQPDEFAKIVHDFNGWHWLGEDAHETWYRLAVGSGAESAVVSVERWIGRTPFVIDGERVHVGKRFSWEGSRWVCTSIEKDFIRAKRDEGVWNPETRTFDALPATLRQIPRAGMEAKIAADKAAEKAKRDAEREANRPDPVALLPLDQHLANEARNGRKRDYWRSRPDIPDTFIEWAKGYGTDYRRAWRECEGNGWLMKWAEAIGLGDNLPWDDDRIRKRFSWPKVEAQIFRFVRQTRGLSLRDDQREAS